MSREFLAIGCYINSALYLAAVFIAGLTTGNPWAWKLAIAAMGVTYLCFLVQVYGLSLKVVNAVVAASIIFGAAAGVALLGVK